MSNLIEQIKSDRDLGTPGPWDNKGEHTADTEFGVFAGAGRSICSSGSYSDGLAGTYFENCCNATRIARVPAMEEALLAAVEALEWIDENGEGSHPANVIAVAREAIAKMEVGQ